MTRNCHDDAPDEKVTNKESSQTKIRMLQHYVMNPKQYNHSKMYPSLEQVVLKQTEKFETILQQMSVNK